MIIRRLEKSEIEYYERDLYKLQDALLDLVEGNSFYLTGGTCLSRFYFRHRYSDDLDFFFRGDRQGMEEFEAEYAEIIARIKSVFPLSVTVSAPSFKRAFVSSENMSLKVEFVYEPFPVIGERVKQGSFYIDAKENIAVNKITAVYSRKTAKDFFDLYFLLQEFSLEKLISQAEIKMIPPSYEELIMSLENSFWEGQVLTGLDINENDFYHFTRSFIDDLLAYAKQAG
ncbi:nucleotidyl transferase AbiEii/AbiGii toxin family protein [candidate division KSB1 bacterium]|nr:nucleotidyl transferase AbiEii/AbiGii toxin family protein [candidate division KSB1 bacterium]